MAKIGGHWRGFVKGIALACVASTAVMAGFGWLDRDISTIGGDLLRVARKYLQVDEQKQTSPPERADIYAQTGRNPLNVGGVELPGISGADNEDRVLASHQSKGAMIGRPTFHDADTLTLNGLPMRLWGIDAPELLQNCARSGRWACGEQAKAELVDFVSTHRIACYDKGRDADGRMMAQCFVGNIDINGWLARSGWAFALRDKTFEYVSRESMAKMKRYGMWRDTAVEAPWEWRQRQ